MVQGTSFPEEYEKRRPPQSFLKDTSNPEVQNIIDRELIRDNIYSKHKFDIYEYPFVVFYEKENSTEVFKPFKSIKDAADYCTHLKSQDIYCLLISIMSHKIDCQLYARKADTLNT